MESLQAIYRTRHPLPLNIFYTNPKAKAYAAAGITEGWVVNLTKIELIVMRYPPPD